MVGFSQVKYFLLILAQNNDQLINSIDMLFSVQYLKSAACTEIPSSGDSANLPTDSISGGSTAPDQHVSYLIGGEGGRGGGGGVF